MQFIKWMVDIYMEKKLERVASVASVVVLEGKRIIRLEGQVRSLQQKKNISDRRVKASEKKVKVGQCFNFFSNLSYFNLCPPAFSRLH